MAYKPTICKECKKNFACYAKQGLKPLPTVCHECASNQTLWKPNTTWVQLPDAIEQIQNYTSLHPIKSKGIKNTNRFEVHDSVKDFNDSEFKEISEEEFYSDDNLEWPVM